MLITIPENLSSRLRRLAKRQKKSIETVLTNRLFTALDDELDALPTGEQAELRALHHLSDDTLRTIAAEKMLPANQSQMASLMTKNSLGQLSEQEQIELGGLGERGDQLMLRKAEAVAILNLQQNSNAIQSY